MITRHSQAPQHKGDRADVLGSSGTHDQQQQHEEYHAEAQGSSGRHDQPRQHNEQTESSSASDIKALEHLFDKAQRTEPSW